MLISQNIRQLIHQATQQANAYNNLEQHIEQVLGPHMQKPGPQATKEAAKLVFNYIEQVPLILDQVIQSASQYGELETIAPLLNQAAHYFFDPMDYIPDHNGIYGLLDDAYLCLKMLESINQVYLREYGSYLLPMDLNRMNRSIRPFLGQTLAAQLDSVITTLVDQRAYEVSAMQQLGQHGYNSPQGLVSKDWGNTEQNNEQFLFDQGVVMDHQFVDDSGQSW